MAEFDASSGRNWNGENTMQTSAYNSQIRWVLGESMK